MTVGRVTLLLLLAAITALLLFEVTFAPRFSLPHESRQPDAAQEARFHSCFERRDAEIHAEAFGTIDNPDVQRDFINRHREEARRDCRERFPERTVTVEEPLDVNLVDLRFRWD